MTISSAAVPPAIGNGPLGGSAKGAEPVPAGLFELLLPADGAGDPKIAPGDQEEPSDADSTDEEMAPYPAAQTNLAALLYTLSVVDAPPLPVEALPSEDSEAIDDAEPDLSVPEASVDEGKPRPQGAANFSAPQKAGAIPPEALPANSSPAPLAATPAGTVFKISPSPAKADVSLDEEQMPPVKKTCGTGGAKRVLEMHEASAMNPNSRPSVPDARSGAAGLTTPFMTRGGEFSGQTQSNPQDPILSAPQKAGAIPPEALPANSSPAPLAATPAGTVFKISPSPAEVDVSLDEEQMPLVKKTRGTGGAKRVLEMHEASAMNPNSRPSVPDARSGAAGLTTPFMTRGEEFSGQTQSNPQDRMPAGATETNRSNPESFSLPASLTQPVTTNGIVSLTTALKPTAPAAVVDEVGLGLERMQQQGHSRVELRLALEGGGEVSIELQVRDGAVQASFITGSAELRDALQQSWSQLASRSEHFGMSLAAPIFKEPATASANGGHQNFRERGHEPQQEQNPSPDLCAAAHQPKRPGPSTVPRRTSTSGLSAWA